MGKKNIRFLGIFSISIGLFLMLFSLPNITGNVILENNGNFVFSFFGLIAVVSGIVLFMISRIENLAKEILDSGRVIDKPRPLIKIAKKMGYGTKNVKEGTQIYDLGNNAILSVVPHSNISGEVSKGVLGSLARGESNFRKYKDK